MADECPRLGGHSHGGERCGGHGGGGGGGGSGVGPPSKVSRHEKNSTPGVQPARSEEQEEQRHFREVVRSFLDYKPYMMLEVSRRERHFKRMSAAHQAKVPGMEAKIDRLKAAALSNFGFLSGVVEEHPATPPGGRLSAERHMSKILSTLHQLVRDWSTEGAPERDRCYGHLLRELEEQMPVTDATRNKQRVLVPGAGLNRLALELASRGYCAQGNEFSYFMLLVSNYVLNSSEEAECMTIYPWIDQVSWGGRVVECGGGVYCLLSFLPSCLLAVVQPHWFRRDEYRPPCWTHSASHMHCYCPVVASVPALSDL